MAGSPASDPRPPASDGREPFVPRAGYLPPVASYLARRLAQGVIVLALVSVLIFAATNVLPGSVAETVLGKQATPANIARLDAKLGLNRPLPEQYATWMSGAVHGDFGRSAVAVAENNLGDSSVGAIVGVPLRNSAILALLAFAVILPLSVLLGTIAGVRAGSGLDYAISYPALLLGAFPEFVLGIALIALFFTALGWLVPVALVPPGSTPLSHPTSLILPIMTLAGVSVGWAARQVRAGVAEVIQRDYVMMARLAGISERRVLFKFALRNALATTVQVQAQIAQYLLGGIIVVEVLFSYPGVGNLLDQSVQARDTTVVAAIGLILAAVYIVINIIADVIVLLLVPKLRTSVLS
jgi:peptide/nickel transport system permease protein